MAKTFNNKEMMCSLQKLFGKSRYWIYAQNKNVYEHKMNCFFSRCYVGRHCCNAIFLLYFFGRKEFRFLTKLHACKMTMAWKHWWITFFMNTELGETFVLVIFTKKFFLRMIRYLILNCLLSPWWNQYFMSLNLLLPN